MAGAVNGPFGNQHGDEKYRSRSRSNLQDGLPWHATSQYICGFEIQGTKPLVYPVRAFGSDRTCKNDVQKFNVLNQVPLNVLHGFFLVIRNSAGLNRDTPVDRLKTHKYILGAARDIV